eukprot:gene14142-15619_t
MQTSKCLFAAQKSMCLMRNLQPLANKFGPPKFSFIDFRTTRALLHTSRGSIYSFAKLDTRTGYDFQSSRKYSEEKVEEKPDNRTFKEKVRDFWNGPTFKYWFIGVTAFSTWMFYYGIKTYRATRVDIDLPPATPGHPLVVRVTDTHDILSKIKHAMSWNGNVKLVSLNGPTGCGKSLLANSMAEKLMQEVDWNPVGLPKSHIKVFLNADTLKSFHLSLQAFAAKLKVKSSDIKSRTAEFSKDESILNNKCLVLLQLIKENLAKHPDWVIIVDNLQQGVSEEIISIVKDAFAEPQSSGFWNPFSSEEKPVLWSRGTVILTHDGGMLDDNTGISQLKMDARMSENDSIQLLKDITNIRDESFESSPSTKLLLSRIHYHPMSIVGTALLLKDRLAKRELSSIDGEMMKLVKEITNNSINVSTHSFGDARSGIAESLIIAETVVAMTAKHLMRKDIHVGCAFDLISSCAPRIPIPSSFVNRYLRHPALRLPAIAPAQQQPGGIQQMFQPAAEQKAQLDESLEPKGHAWSNKNIAEQLSSFKTRVMEFFTALKEVYDMYYGSHELDVAVDDGLGVLRRCELILSSKQQPGDVDSFSMHPLVYAAVRQNFLSSTIPKMEAKFIDEEEARFEQQPWYKKMSKFDAKACLQKHRNEQQKMPIGASNAAMLLSGFNNAIIDVGCILGNDDDNDDGLSLVDSSLTEEDKLKYLQAHLDRIIHTLSDDMQVAKQNISGKTASKYLSVHGDYLHYNHPAEITGTRAKITGLLLLAKTASRADADVHKAIAHVSAALELLQQTDMEVNKELEMASILCQLASLYNSLEDHEKGKENLEKAVEIYEAQRRKDGEYKNPLDFGKALGALGVIYGTLGDRRKSKELIERALMLQQTGAPDLTDEAKSKHFGAEFASSLTDLGHAYVSLGLPLYGKKILDLSLMAHKNIHGEKHPEVVRTLTVLSIAHLMQGHNDESKKLRREAGKLQAQVNALPVY